MSKPRPKILIGLPTMSSVHVLLVVTIMSWLVESMKKGDIDISVYPTMNVQPVDNARNEIVEEFMKSDCTHLLFIDSDTIPPLDALQKLIAHDYDIVTAITPIIDLDKNSEIFYRKWNCVDMNDKHVKKNTGLVEIKGAGSSCILIKRAVFEKMEKPYYRFIYEDDNKKPVIVSEDIYFIAKAKGLGFKIYADTDIVCKHYKSIIW